ncbi:MAG: glycosyl hydrolase, partial [Thermoanaerobaculia bacterium]
QGPLWAPGGDRGLYKTTDGGQTWEQVLEISDNTGVTDLVIDPQNPDVLIAASFQRRRRVWALVAGGPESALYKSYDAGKTWKKLTSGLPEGDLGRIGLAVSPIDPDVVYATIPASRGESGFFRSADRGETWTKMSDYIPVDPQYYQEIFPDPHRFDRVYSMDVWIHVTDDGGRTFRRLNSEFKHVDNHAMVFDPDDPDYLMVGCDGGIYESWDLGKTWRFIDNLPVTQFYRVGLDNDLPFYNVYGGTQDNDSQGGPSRTTNVHGIRNSDWFITVGGDGYQTRIDPDDPNILYSMWQYGGLVRYDKRSGEILDIQPQPDEGEPPLNWHWDSPLMISPHSGQRLYFAANRLFRSDDRGDTWVAVSPDLTRGIDRNQLPVMGRVWSVDAVWKNVFTSFYGNIVALDESPLVEGLIYVGTDDGLVQVTDDGGETWREIGSFPGIPERTYVADLTASRHDVDTVYAVFNNHKSGDFKPYLLKSTDRGSSWTSVAGDLPDRHVLWSIVEDHVQPGLLFAGTELGLFFTFDGGSQWIELEGGMPTVAIRDLEIQQRENDLVAASFGRGFLILDDYTPLRHITPEVLEQEAVLFPVKKTWMYLQSRPLGWGEKAVQGHGYFTAPNPPFGAVFTYYLRDDLETLKEQRQKAEQEIQEEGGDTNYPSWEELRVEDREEEPAVILTVTDGDGQVVTRVEGPVTAGIHRVAWNLRYPSPEPVRLVSDPDDDDPGGPPVVPGSYTVGLAKRVDGKLTPVSEPQTFETVPLGLATLAAEDREELLAFQQQVGRLQRAVLGANEVARETAVELQHIKKAIMETPEADPALMEEARALELRLADIQTQLTGDRTVSRRSEPTVPSIVRRVNRSVEAHWSSTSAATTTHQRNYEIAATAFAGVLADLRQLVEVDLRHLEEALEAAGAPWTPGRGLPAWEPE